jgi:integrase
MRDQPLSDMTLTKVLRTAIAGDWTVHGFRSSFRDWAAEKTSFPREVAETALAHTNPDKTEASYRRTNYLDKRRDMMQQWADYVVTAQSTG